MAWVALAAQNMVLQRCLAAWVETPGALAPAGWGVFRQGVSRGAAAGTRSFRVQVFKNMPQNLGL